jgi:hypothetical protein
MRLRRSSLDLSQTQTQTQTQAGPAARPTGALYAAGSLFSRDGRPTPAPDARQTQQIFTVTTREYLRSWSLSAGHRGPTPVPDAQPCLKSRVMCSLGSMIGARRGGRQRGATRHGWASVIRDRSAARSFSEHLFCDRVCVSLRPYARADVSSWCLTTRSNAMNSPGQNPAAPRDNMPAGSIHPSGFDSRRVVWSVRCLPCAGLCNDALVLPARSFFRRNAK